MKRYSIIIPHKNSVSLLVRLLETIPNDPCFEIIVVDDNSESFYISQLIELKNKFDLQIFFNKTNGGAGHARNIGLDLSIGKWILFADADDLFSDSFFDIVESHFNSTADIVYFNTFSVYSDTMEVAYRHERYSGLVLNFIENPKYEDNLKYFFTPPWAKMFKRKLLSEHNIVFDEVIASNDILFSLKSAHKASKIEAFKEVLYIITVNKGSLVNTFSKSNFESKFLTAIRANNFLRSIKKVKFQQSVLYFLFKSKSFGWKFLFKTIWVVIKNRSNLFIGLEKIFSLKKIMRERENKKYLISK